MLIHFNEEIYSDKRQKELEKDIQKYIPDSSKECLKKGVSNLYDNNIRPSKHNSRFHGHFSSGICGKKSLSFFCKFDIDRKILYIVVIGCHKFEKQKKNKKSIHSTTYRIFYQTPDDRNKYGKGNINL